MQRQHHAQLWAWIFSIMVTGLLFAGIGAWIVFVSPVSADVSLAAKNPVDPSNEDEPEDENIHESIDESHADADPDEDEVDSEEPEADSANHENEDITHGCVDETSSKPASPVDLQKADIKFADLASPLEFHFVPSSFEARGSTIDWTPGNFLRVQGREYQLQSTLFVSPSDHRMFGAEFSSEIQFRLMDQQRNVAMLSVLVKTGKTHSELERLISVLHNLESNEDSSSSENTKIDLKKLFPNSANYYQYVGTDPESLKAKCSESAIWHIMKAPIVASEDQVSFLKSLARKPLPLQKPSELMIWYNDVDANGP